MHACATRRSCCRARWPRNCTPTAIIAPRRCSKRPRASARRTRDRDWRYWLDELFLHPQLGPDRQLAVFARCCSWCSTSAPGSTAMTSARLVEWASDWQPDSTGRRGRARGGRRPDRTDRHRRALHDSAGAAAGGAGRGRRDAAHRLRRSTAAFTRSACTAASRCRSCSASAATCRRFPAIGEGHQRPRARRRLGADHLRALLGALGDHPRAGRQVPGRRSACSRFLLLTMVVIAVIGQAAAAPLSARRPRPGAGNSAVCAAAPGADAARDLGAHQRHPHHRHAAAGRRQRGAGAARIRRRRPRRSIRH